MPDLTISITSAAATRIKDALEFTGWSGTNAEAVDEVKRRLIIHLVQFVQGVERTQAEIASRVDVDGVT